MIAEVCEDIGFLYAYQFCQFQHVNKLDLALLYALTL